MTVQHRLICRLHPFPIEQGNGIIKFPVTDFPIFVSRKIRSFSTEGSSRRQNQNRRFCAFDINGSVLGNPAISAVGYGFHYSSELDAIFVRITAIEHAFENCLPMFSP